MHILSFLFFGNSEPSVQRRIFLASKLFIVAAFLIHCQSERILPHSEDQLIHLESGGMINISKRIEFLSANKSSDIISITEKETGWTGNTSGVFDRGFSDQVHWIRFQVKNDSEATHWYLALQNNRMNFVDFYTLQKTGNTEFHSGDHLPIPGKAKASFPYMDFVLNTGETAVIYIRIETDSHIGFPVHLMSSEDFGSYIYVYRMHQIGFFLIILLYILLHLLFNRFLNIRLKILLALAVVSGYGYFYFLYGDGNRIFLSDTVIVREYVPFVSLFVFGFCFTLFIKDYLRFYEMGQYYNWFANALAFSFLFLFPLLFSSVPNSMQSSIRSLDVMIMYSFMIYGGVVNVLKKRYWVFFSIFAWVIIFAFSIASTLMLLHVIEYSIFFENGIFFSFILEFLLVLVSTMYRYRQLEKDRIVFQEKLHALVLENKNLQKSSSPVPEEGNEIESTQYNRRTNGIDRHKTVKEIIRIFEEKKPYLKEDFDLADLSRFCGLRIDQVSAIINNELNTNFRTLVNEYRIREACRLIQETMDENLLGIAFASGFGSKTAFNRTFKNTIGISPQDFRKQHAFS
ncbi:7TM-DISM domain-containing protein [Leptospira sp. 'Mane']|uniref:7TM-DISM domain-containing protein n=1 Tax=Leptospira sp. 'Mane' TaxID=3387407 RepID=UPI00398B6068